MQRDANIKVLNVSELFSIAGPIVAINAVFAFPPNESCASFVKLLSRNGMCGAFGSANAATTFPNADKD